LRGRSYYQPSGTSSNGTAYVKVFVKRVHQLIGEGYAELTPSDFTSAEEEHITGELVKSIDALLDDPKAPPWTRFFSIHEDPRVHDKKRMGNRRLKLDIRIDSSETRPRSRMRFEAKRLGPNHAVGVYLGVDGIQCILDGRYARNDSIAGMIGYVQKDTPSDWAGKIEKAMGERTAELDVTGTGQWVPWQITPELSWTYRSIHDRPGVGPTIEILHTLLRFN
jgi:hypothetical protein